MRSYELTKDAEADLEGIARYTIEEWGETQAESYLKKSASALKISQQTKLLLGPSQKIFLTRG